MSYAEKPMTDPILAKAFANSNSTEQAHMLNSLARELFVGCGGRFKRNSVGGYENQVCMISSDLNADGIQFVKDLHAFIELREKDMK